VTLGKESRDQNQVKKIRRLNEVTKAKIIRDIYVDYYTISFFNLENKKVSIKNVPSVAMKNTS